MFCLNQEIISLVAKPICQVILSLFTGVKVTPKGMKIPHLFPPVINPRESCTNVAYVLTEITLKNPIEAKCDVNRWQFILK